MSVQQLSFLRPSPTGGPKSAGVSWPDPWATDQLFFKARHPHPEFAFAVVGPIDPWHANRATKKPVKCLLVSADRTQVWLKSTSGGSESLEIFWNVLAARVQECADKEIGTGGESFDQLMQWETWVPSTGDPVPSAVRRYYNTLTGVNALADDDQANMAALCLGRQELQAATKAALSQLTPELARSATERPSLRISSVSVLLRYAHEFGEQGTRYMNQMLRTESLGLINAAADELHRGLAPNLAGAVCRGQSLPKTLLANGVPPWLHRWTLKSDAMNQFDCDGDLWLASLNAVAVGRSSLNASECKNIALQLQFIQQNVPENVSGAIPLLRKTLDRLNVVEDLLPRYDVVCTAICGRVRNVSARNIPRQSVLQWLIDQPIDLVLDRQIAPLLKVADTHFLKDRIDEAVNEVLRLQPVVPEEFKSRGSFQLEPLTSLQTILQEGKRLRNCLKDLEQVIQYMAWGCVLYAIKDGRGTCAFVALMVECSSANQPHQVLVHEIATLEIDHPAIPIMYRDAWELAVCLSDRKYRESFGFFKANAITLARRLDC